MNAIHAASTTFTAQSWGVRSIGDRASDAALTSPLITVMWLALGLALLWTIVTSLGVVLIYAERKVAAHFQCRLGPMRVGWHGVLQSIADSFKLLGKEDLVPSQADKFLFLLAPFFVVGSCFMVLSALPISPILQVLDLNIGVLYVTGAAGFGVIGILLGGWSSNNKWSLLGAMRTGAQMISYEISIILTLLIVVLFSGTMRLSGIVLSQEQGWWIWRAHGIGLLAFLMFVVSSVAEINRAPFDMSEGESELTAGFHTEYSGMRFSLFFLAEFANMFIAAGLAATLFLGGWMPFHIGNWQAFNSVMDIVPPVIWFVAKTMALVFLMMWFRWTFPRLRVDQLMQLEWKILLPAALVNLLLAAIAVSTGAYFFPTAGG